MAKKILLVDDDIIQQKLVKAIVAPAGFELITALNGQQGIEMVKKEKPDLILMDVMMPEMDGYTAVSVLKADSETKDIPVIMVTAVGFELNRQLALLRGAADYITKPIDIDLLLKKINLYLKAEN
jgi:CheY-like chemotaxis protein